MDRNPAFRALAETVTKALARELGNELVSVVLYGSVAREEAGPESDVDLLVVVESAPPGRLGRDRLVEGSLRSADVEASKRCLRDREFVVSLAVRVLSRAEAVRTRPLYLDMTEDAVLLHDRDGFFAGVLDRLRGRMRELGSRRLRLADGARYWVLKPEMSPGEVVEL